MHEQIRKPGSLFSTNPVLYPTLCPAPSAPSGAILATFLSQEGLACGGGAETVTCFHCHSVRTRGKQPPASGSFRTVCLPTSPGPPAFCSQRQEQGFQTWRISDRRQLSRSSRTTLIRSLIAERQLTHFDCCTSRFLNDSVKWELLFSPFYRWGDRVSEWLSDLPQVSHQVNSKAKTHS